MTVREECAGWEGARERGRGLGNLGGQPASSKAVQSDRALQNSCIGGIAQRNVFASQWNIGLKCLLRYRCSKKYNENSDFCLCPQYLAGIRPAVFPLLFSAHSLLQTYLTPLPSPHTHSILTTLPSQHVS